ncbi:hypothetical protein EPI10_015685 [Gossypium australe]|uniref:Uncharacterized protein n=1 Tax=Gossypium australe TaxID=47621 RepID=A0A5B6VLL0_9ROSI|nr:hypothetical protein EPI10_015685 [Gossypium australe]
MRPASNNKVLLNIHKRIHNKHIIGFDRITTLRGGHNIKISIIHEPRVVKHSCITAITKAPTKDKRETQSEAASLRNHREVDKVPHSSRFSLSARKEGINTTNQP